MPVVRGMFERWVLWVAAHDPCAGTDLIRVTRHELAGPVCQRWDRPSQVCGHRLGAERTLEPRGRLHANHPLQEGKATGRATGPQVT